MTNADHQAECLRAMRDVEAAARAMQTALNAMPAHPLRALGVEYAHDVESKFAVLRGVFEGQHADRLVAANNDGGLLHA